MADLERNERLAWGSPEQVRDALIELAEALGAGTLLLNFNQGHAARDVSAEPGTVQHRSTASRPGACCDHRANHLMGL